MNIIEEYFKLIDQNKFSEVLNLFSKNIVYNRCGKKIKGISNLKKFYLVERKISGKHKIRKTNENKNTITVKGSFTGKNSKNEEIIINFTDIFQINKENKIEKRTTYADKDYPSTI